MKKILALLLVMLLLMLAIPLAALAIGQPTPPTGNSDSSNNDSSTSSGNTPKGSTGDNNSDGSNSDGNNSDGNTTDGNTTDGNNSDGSDSGDNNSGSNTPNTNNTGSNNSGNSSNTNNTGSNNSGNTSDTNNTGSNNSGSGSPVNNSGDGAQPGGTILDTYEYGRYRTEANTEQQIIENAQQQYSGPRLSSLSVAGLELIPVFSSETFYYTAYVPNGQNSVSIIAAAAAESVVYIDGMAGNSRQISVSGTEQTVRIIVVAGSSTTTYSIVLLSQQQVQAIPQAQLSADFPVLTHVRLENSEFFYEQDIYTTGGDIYITLPQASKKSFSITLSSNINVVTYCNNIRVYNVVYNTMAGAWQWKRQYIEMRIPETRLEIFLANQKKLDVVNTYNLILRQPTENLNIQLQVGNTEAMVNDVVHGLDAPPVIMDGHTMVPLRFIAEALGAQVSWESTSKRVELNWQEKKLELFIGQLADNMPKAPFIENGRTMVPLRYVSERLNCQVEWVAATKEIIITR